MSEFLSGSFKESFKFKQTSFKVFAVSQIFVDVVNLNLKSTLRVLYNLFTNYKNSE